MILIIKFLPYIIILIFNEHKCNNYAFFFSAEDCLALYQAGQTCSGVYTLHPAGGANTDVVCDMETMGGGWTVSYNICEQHVSDVLSDDQNLVVENYYRS